MNKVQFVNEVTTWAQTNGLEMSDLLVSHGGAMLLMGLRSETGDVDLHVTQAVWDKFVPNGSPVELGDGVSLLSVTPHIDIHVGGFGSEQIAAASVSPEGIRYRSRSDTLEDYLKLNRSKDAASIKLLKEKES